MTGLAKGKKYPGKFTLQFNMMDPAQREAAGLLDSMGRVKAQFIANAIQYYRFHAENPEAPVSAPPVDYALVESIVCRILAEKETEPPAVQEPERKAPKALRQSEDIRMDDAAGLLGEENMAAISRTIAAFRQK